MKRQNSKNNAVYFYLLIALSAYLLISPIALAGPSSSHFELKQYQFGAGGTDASMSSTNYKMFGTAGEVEYGSPSSSHYGAGSGLVYTLMANLPPAPTFTNPSNFYNKLKLVVNTGNNPTDTEYAIAVSNDNFISNTAYVQTDGSLGSTMVWQTYANWNGASGVMLIGLSSNTTYTAKVAARQGIFTQTAFGIPAQAATINPTMSFSISPNSVNIGQLAPGTVTTAATSVTTTVTTNGTSGAVIYIYGTNNGLSSPSVHYTINTVSNNLASGALAEGYGAQATSTSQSSGGPMEILSPYNGGGDTVGILDTTQRPIFDSSTQSVTSGQGIFALKAKASNVTYAASDYTDILTVIAAATF